jgi:hypothetical protein
MTPNPSIRPAATFSAITLGAVLLAAAPAPLPAAAQDAPPADRPTAEEAAPAGDEGGPGTVGAPGRRDTGNDDDAPPPPDAEGRRPPFDERLFRQGFGFDVQIQGGFGVGIAEGPPYYGLGRGRVGFLHVGARWVSSLGGAFSVGGLSDGWAAGAQGDLLHRQTGIVFEAGASYARNEAVLVDLSVGWSIFAFEYQWRGDEQLDAEHALFFKLRLPLGLILFFL